MNNGKVRIYELSRELNLDNRDILAVCEQLNIPVKSHSSTIASADAERIRAYAEKYVASHPSHSKSAPAKHKGRTEQPESGAKPAGQKPQQILEVRQHTPRTAPKSPASGSEANPQVLVQPQPSGHKRPQQTSKPSMLNRPVRPNQSETAGAAESGSEKKAEKAMPVPASDQSVPPPSQPKEPKPARPAAKAPEGPKLTAPPVRPSAPPPPGAPAQGKENRPVPKPKKAEPTAPAPAQAQAAEAPPTPAPSPKVAVAAAGTAVSPVPGPAKAKPKRPAELVRPQLIRPNAPPAARAPGVSEPETEEEESETPSLLAKPAPPRPPKKAKKREDEEEELQELEKAGKAGTKAKRRTKPIEEDDEDLVSDLDELPETVQVSLSIARPAKQKVRPAAAKPAAAAPALASAAKAKKSGTARQSEGGAKMSRRDRREQQEKKQRPDRVVLMNSMTVRELAEELAVPETDIVKLLFFKGMAVNITQTLDLETSTLVAKELGVEVDTAAEESEARKTTEMLDAEDMENLQLRPPVVTIMGHVDHGKTTLLDTIRKTKVAQGEAGGITQHIGAYHVDVEQDGSVEQVVFLDTPGHEAFTAMRARGARVTDIAVLVVAADDGVRPQTVEAISHAKAAEVPIVVAINKIDKEGAQPERVKQELTEYGLVPEEWGGSTIMVPVSAIRGENLDTLLEMILLVAEVEQLSANPDRPAKGTVIEAHLDKARGPVATLLVQNGTLQVGDVLVAGSAFGKVRAMLDDRARKVDAATPSFAVEVLGLNAVPAAGDDFEVFLDEKEARAIADQRSEENRQSRLQQAMAARRVTLSGLSQQAKEGQLKELNLILKADVQGSVEAILGALQQLPQNEVQVRVLLAAAGEITETDVDLAAASDAVIVGFSTTLASGARQAADQAGVDVREYNIIYKLLDDIQGAMEGLLEPELVEEALGQAEVRAVFASGKGAVAGCYIQNGKVVRNSKVRVRRGGSVIHEGTLDSLRRIKDDVKEVNAGFECGIGLDNFHDWATGDIIEAFRMVTKRRTLSSN
ncbi:translation initiation factor IF-2 [Kamptonema formosum]|uniref:translation initiation factor IF-2 n=1 Tax=Kamptonema formosum TaxID=331992 RepID=UPI0003785891|nr:translation initiation factor IF-2 [Oscillatoria sp. PCC 10802]